MNTEVEKKDYSDATLTPVQKNRILGSDRELPDIVVSNRFAGLNVLGLVADNSACGYYRVVNPLHYLKMNGANVHYGSHHSMDNFLKYDYIIAPRQHSQDVYEILRFVMWEGKGGTPFTKILTPTGWTTFKDVKVGDRVIGSDGKSCNVVGRYERGVLPTYRVTMSDDSSVLCDGTHQWSVIRKSQRATDKNTEVLSTNDLLGERLKLKGGYNFQIPIVSPVEFTPSSKLPIDPYLMGVILGDGCISSRNFYISSDNLKMADEINKVLPDNHYLDVHNDRQYYRFSIKSINTEGKKKVNPCRDSLKELGLIGTDSSSKFIPEIYLNASIEDRLSLIQGLMDTDGTVCKNQRSFTTVSKKLSDGLTYLIRSLGGTTRTYKTPPRQGGTKDVYVVNPNLPSEFSMFRMKQYKDIVVHKNPVRAIKSIELEGQEPIICIAVDSSDNLYVTDDFIVTHNCVVYEIDDDLDAVLPSSPAYWAYHQGSPELQMIHKVMSWADGVTTTTPEMARWCSQNNRNVGILENYIDFSFRDWGADVTYEDGLPIITPKPIIKPKEWEGKIVVGYAAGTTHQEDVKIMGPQISALLKKHSNVHFALYMSPNQAKEFMETYQIPEGRYTIVEARHFLDFPSGLHGIDIGLCPLVCNQFNLAKSFLKCIEYMAVGIVPITSNVGPYARFNTRHPGYIVNTGRGNCEANSLIEGVEFLLDNPDILRERQIKGRQLIVDKYSLEKNIANWPATWMAINERKLQGDVGPPVNKKPKNYYRSYGNVGRNDPCPCGSGLKYSSCCIQSYGN